MSVKVKQINDERMGRWKERLNEQEATPVILIGVKHDNSGQLVLLCTEDRTDDEIKLFLRGVLKQLEG